MSEAPPPPPSARATPLLGIVGFVALWLLGTTADAWTQPPDHVRLTLLEASARAESRSCTLEVSVGNAAGEAILTCDRKTAPVSHLAAHRVLTPSEAARLYELTSATTPPRPQSTTRPAPANDDGARVTMTITRGSGRQVLDVTGGAAGLPEHDQQLLRLLREIADELRGTRRPLGQSSSASRC